MENNSISEINKDQLSNSSHAKNETRSFSGKVYDIPLRFVCFSSTKVLSPRIKYLTISNNGIYFDIITYSGNLKTTYHIDEENHSTKYEIDFKQIKFLRFARDNYLFNITLDECLYDSVFQFKSQEDLFLHTIWFCLDISSRYDYLIVVEKLTKNFGSFVEISDLSPDSYQNFKGTMYKNDKYHSTTFVSDWNDCLVLNVKMEESIRHVVYSDNLKSSGTKNVKRKPMECLKQLANQIAVKQTEKKYAYNPSPDHSIEISASDLACLRPNTYVNDNIVNMYMAFLYHEVLTDEQRTRSYFFNCFFFTRLVGTKSQMATDTAQTRHARVAKWTKNVNIFDMDYLVMPVMENKVWFLVIVCFPWMVGMIDYGQIAKRKATQSQIPPNDSRFASETRVGRLAMLKNDDQCDPMPCILMFDSLEFTSGKHKFKMFHEYLQSEWDARHHDLHGPLLFDKSTIAKYYPKLPQQVDDNIDCGIHLLHYVESFFKDPIKSYRSGFFNYHLAKWFDELHVNHKRLEIKEQIANVFNKAGYSSFKKYLSVSKVKLPLKFVCISSTKILTPKIKHLTINNDLIQFECFSSAMEFSDSTAGLSFSIDICDVKSMRYSGNNCLVSITLDEQCYRNIIRDQPDNHILYRFTIWFCLDMRSIREYLELVTVLNSFSALTTISTISRESLESFRQIMYKNDKYNTDDFVRNWSDCLNVSGSGSIHIELDDRSQISNVKRRREEFNDSQGQINSMRINRYDEKYVYSPFSGASVEFLAMDLLSLLPGGTFNDNIINLYMTYFYHEVLAEQQRNRTYIFNCFFNTRLVGTASSRTTDTAITRHGRVAKWTKNVDIFEKDFLFIPVLEGNHWFLVIVCFPWMAGMIDYGAIFSHEQPISQIPNNTTEFATKTRVERAQIIRDEMRFDPKPCILFFDSSQIGNIQPLDNVIIIREYLQCEWDARRSINDGPLLFDKVTIRGYCPKVALEYLESDSGVFLLSFVESFFKQPVKDFSVEFFKENLLQWFDSTEILAKRAQIKDVIDKIVLRSKNAL